MAVGKRRSVRQEALFVAASEISASEHPFYRALDKLLREDGFDEFAEEVCGEFYAGNVGRPEIPPGVYFRADGGIPGGRVLRSIVRWEGGAGYEAWLRELAQASGIETPTREELAKPDRKRPKKGSNAEWVHPGDPEARITKMKEGRTRLGACGGPGVGCRGGRDGADDGRGRPGVAAGDAGRGGAATGGAGCAATRTSASGC